MKRQPFAVIFMFILNPNYWFIIPSIKINEGIYIISVAWLIFGFQINCMDDNEVNKINETIEDINS